MTNALLRWPARRTVRYTVTRWVVRVLASLVLLNGSAQAQPQDVALAGFAYSGAQSTIDRRFPHSRLYEKSQQDAGTPIFQTLFRALTQKPAEHVRIVAQLDALKGKAQAIAVALVIGSETTSVEQFGDAYKLMVLIRGQAMFFDFKSMNIVRSYPISFAYVDLLGQAPDDAQIQQRVKLVYEGAAGKPGLLERFSTSVSQATLASQVSRYLQVTSAQIKPEAVEFLPAYVRGDAATAQTWAADLVSEALSTRLGIPLVPFSKGYAIGNTMSLRVSDGTVWQLNLPKPDYEISVELSQFKKIKFSEVAGGATTYVYGAYGQIHIEEPLSRKVYLSTALKNGESRVIPASQQYVDDAPHFYDALNGMFVKLAQTIDGKLDDKWLKGAAAAKDIDKQVLLTSELIKLCQ